MKVICLSICLSVCTSNSHSFVASLEFDINSLYSWSTQSFAPVETPMSPQRPVRMLRDQVWPPPLPVSDSRLKYTEAEHQLLMLAASKDYGRQLERIEKRYQDEIEKLGLRHEKRIAELEKEMDSLAAQLREQDSQREVVGQSSGVESSAGSAAQDPLPPPPPPPPPGLL